MRDDCRVTREIPYFAYGTLQVGLPNHGLFADLLGTRVSRVRTVDAHAIVVPKHAGCSNPGCGLLHRMAGLVPGIEPFHAEGDLFMVDEGGIAEIDRLEGCADGSAGPYVRSLVDIVAVDGGAGAWRAAGYLVHDPEGWRSLLARGAADAFSVFDPRLVGGSAPKACCLRDPGHTGAHEVVNPLDRD